MRSTAFPDLFELEPSTAAYVPRRATVEALAQLQNAIEHDEPVALLRGPPGIGKTLLLRLLRRRVEGRISCIALEAADQTCDALCAQALRVLGREPDAAPVEELARAASERERAGVLLLIDRAENLSTGALQPLLDLAARCPPLQIVLAAESPAGDHAWLHSPDPRISMVELSEPMSSRETIEYLLARLDLGVAPAEARRRLGWRSWPRLVRESQGNPALLHHLAKRRLEGEGAAELPSRLARRAIRPHSLVPWRWLAAFALVMALVLLTLNPRTPEPAPPPASALREPGAVPKPASEPPAPALAAKPAPAPPTPEVAEPEPLPGAEPSLPAAPAPLPSVEAPGPARAAVVPAAPRPERRPPPPPAPAAARAPVPPPEAAVKAPPAAARAFPRPARVAPAEPDRALGAGDALGVAPSPAPAAASASVPVFVNAVPAARIEIDGRDVGNTPIVGLLIPEGSRLFVANFADGRRLERSVDVEGAEVYVLFP